jgi:hypothetical protein
MPLASMLAHVILAEVLFGGRVTDFGEFVSIVGAATDNAGVVTEMVAAALILLDKSVVYTLKA